MTPAISGTAAAVVQTGQRVGMSLGTAIAATMFFGRLTATRHDYPNAASYGLYGATALVGAALVIGIADLIRARRAQGFDPPSLGIEAPRGGDRSLPRPTESCPGFDGSRE